jgi:hypothetical protein
MSARSTLFTDSGVEKTPATSSSKTTTVSLGFPLRLAKRLGFAFYNQIGTVAKAHLQSLKVDQKAFCS